MQLKTIQRLLMRLKQLMRQINMNKKDINDTNEESGVP